jgi:hypothetical protein
MAKATARLKARRRRPDSVTIAAALERARLKRMVQAKRDIARLAKELKRVTVRAYELTSDYAIELLERRGYDIRPRIAVAEQPKTDAAEDTV